MYDLRVVVEEIGGFCDLPVTPGDYFELRGSRLYIPEGKFICMWALQSLMPMLPAKMRELADPNDWMQATSRICCPDPNGLVIYRIERIPAAADEPQAQPAEYRPPTVTAVSEETTCVPASVAEGRVANIGHMVADESVCSGCRACELICSFTHEKEFNPTLSRVQVAKDEAKGLDTPLVCRQCGVARCVQVCPQKALGREPLTKAVLVDRDACNGCGLCAQACPFGVVRLHPETRVPLLCDLCDGDPQCVRRCVTGALWYGEAHNRPKKGRPIGPRGRERADG